MQDEYNQVILNITKKDEIIFDCLIEKMTEMASAKTRKVGNSIMISIPKELNPKSGKEYIFSKAKNGSIVMVPKIDNPFTSDKPYYDDNLNQDFEKAAEKTWKDD